MPVIKEKIKYAPYESVIRFETFRKIGDWEIDKLKLDKPSDFNGNIQIRKYQVTIELIEEPLEVIQARIQELWDSCKNHHHWEALQITAKKYGMKLDFKTMKK